jgi:aspartyl-tRNA synthetase
MGLDRLVMLLSNSETIQEVILFPAMREKTQKDQKTGDDSDEESDQE